MNRPAFCLREIKGPQRASTHLVCADARTSHRNMHPRFFILFCLFVCGLTRAVHIVARPSVSGGPNLRNDQPQLAAPGHIYIYIYIVQRSIDSSNAPSRLFFFSRRPLRQRRSSAGNLQRNSGQNMRTETRENESVPSGPRWRRPSSSASVFFFPLPTPRPPLLLPLLWPEGSMPRGHALLRSTPRPRRTHKVSYVFCGWLEEMTYQPSSNLLTVSSLLLTRSVCYIGR